MSLITFTTYVNMLDAATPSSGHILGYDVDGLLKHKDYNGNIYTYAQSTQSIIVSHNELLDRNVAGNHDKLIPVVNSTQSIQVTKSDGITSVLNIDTLNGSIGINSTNSIPCLVHAYVQDTNQSKDNQDNDLIIDGPLESDKGFILADQNIKKWQQNIYRGEKGRYTYTYNFENKKELIACSETMKLSINKHSNIIEYNTCWMDPIQGLLNDCKIGGIFDVNITARYEVKISSTGVTDTYSWRKSYDYGDTWSDWSDSIDCHIEELDLDEGLTIYFDNINGHNLFDRWQTNAFAQEPDGTFEVHPTKLAHINTVSDYSNPLTYNDYTFSLACNDMPTQKVFEIGTSSAIYIGNRTKFGSIFINITKESIGFELVVEYLDGGIWKQLNNEDNNLTDDTYNFSRLGQLKWNINTISDWSINHPEYNSNDDYMMYWIRIRSNTSITQAPEIISITPNGRYRSSVFASHYDSRPTMFVNAAGRVSIGDSRIRTSSTFNLNGSKTEKTDIITSSIDLNETHNTIICDNSTLITLELPKTSISQNRFYNIILNGTANVILSAQGNDTIDNNISSYTCIRNKNYYIVANGTNWYITNKTDIISTEIPFTPYGNISSNNIQNAIVEVNNNATSSLYLHTSNHSNPHNVSSNQIGYTNSSFNSHYINDVLDSFSNILNKTQGSGILSDNNSISNPDGLYTHRVKVESNNGIINYDGLYKVINWNETIIDFSVGTYSINTTHYIYIDSDENINISTSEPDTSKNILLGNVFWNGTYLTNYIQSNRLLNESISEFMNYMNKIGAFIYDNGCLTSIMNGLGNEMKIINTSGKSHFGLKKYNHSEISSNDIGTLFFPIFLSSDGFYPLYYEIYNSNGNISSTKWNDRTKPMNVGLTGYSLSFTNNGLTVSCSDDLTNILNIGDMIWLNSDTYQYMNNIDSITYSAQTTIILSYPYGGTSSTGPASYTKCYPNIPIGKFTKHLLCRSLDDILYYIPGNNIYDTEILSLSDGSPTLPPNIQENSLKLSHITVQQGDLTLVGKIQDIRPLPFSYRVGGSSGGSLATSHSSLTDLTNDDHLQYLRTDGNRQLTGILQYNSNKLFIDDTDVIDKKYCDDKIITHETTYNHIGIAYDNNVIKKHGFENRTDFVLPSNITSLTFSISGTNSKIWISGTPYIKSPESISILNIPGSWYIKYDNNGILTSTQSMWDLYTDVPLMYIYWNGVEGLIHDERHNSTRNIEWHKFIHLTSGSKYGNGLDLTINNSSFSLSDGTVLDEDIIHDIISQNTCRVFYRDGSNWTWSNKQSTYYVYRDNNIQYDNGNGLTSSNLNYYTCHWMFASNDVDSYIYVIAPQRQDSSLLNCMLNNRYEDLILPDNMPELKILYKIIVKNEVGNFYIDHEDYRTLTSLENRPNSIPHSSILYRDKIGSHPASALNTDVTNFAGLLSSNDTDVQKSLNTLSSVSKSTLGLGLVTNDAQLKRSSGDFFTFSEKINPISSDIVLIEDSSSSYSKKKMQLGNFQKQSITFDAARTGNVSGDQDLRRSDSIPTNISPFISPVNCKLKSISASSLSGTNETWSVQVLVNNVQVAVLGVTASDYSYRNDLSVDINAGDKIRLRFILGSSGTVNSPASSIFMIER